MSKPTKRPVPGLLSLILEDPELVAVVQSLDARSLSQLIRHVGLEDAGEIIAFATTDQLARVFDEDLWRSTAPGQEERFDPARFALWLEVMLEMGPDAVANLLAGMDEDFVTLALSHEVLVLDLDAYVQERLEQGLRGTATNDLIEKALESSFSFELDHYLLISTGRDSWDAVLAVLTSLDTEHHELLIRVLDRCRHLSAEHIEDNGGLYEVLTAAEQLQADVAGEREERREREGFVPPQAAASFLGLAREAQVGEDPITRAHFWNQAQAAAASPAEYTARASTSPAPSAPLLSLLRDAQVLAPAEQVLLLEAGSRRRSEDGSWIRAGAPVLREEDPALFAQRLGELGYLANVLLSGCHFRGRAFRPAEATQAALATADLGLEAIVSRDSSMQEAGRVLAGHGLVHAFGIGWNLLHRDVSMASGEALCGALARHQRAAAKGARDPWASKAMLELRGSLERDLAAGKPWRSRARLVALRAVWDASAVDQVQCLIDECPTFDGAFFSTRRAIVRAGAWRRELLGE